MTRTIIAAGGGGFLMNPDGTPTALDDFILSRARAPRPKVCFLPTASGDSASSVTRFYRAFTRLACTPTDLTVIESTLPRHPAPHARVRDFLADVDVIYTGGGNTANAIAIWRAHGLVAELRHAWEQGTILCGVSAGMVCWFDGAVTDSFGALARLDGLGFLPGSACPHYDNDHERRPVYHRLIRAGELPPGLAADDGAALVFEGTELAEVVTERPDAYGYRVERAASGDVVEHTLARREL
ncbi:MAG: peptidase E [Kofleriaceae bacterium]